jgi:xeroderma pigmentosum group C-complementing protein
MLKGEPYFDRSAVCVVHTAEKWKRQGRIVREDELAKPVKLIKKRGVQQVEADLEYLDPSTSQQLMSSFYGPWQTDVWQMPSAKDGIVPKNEWGSVEIPPLGHALPGGTAHVDLPDAAKVCRRLGIDFADAVNGFEFKKRRMIPTKCGVVICAESEELLRNAHSEYVRHERRVAKEKRLAEGEAAWRDLLTAALTHLRVHRSFADDVEAALLEHASMKHANGISERNRAGSKKRKEEKQGEGLPLPEDNLVSDEIEEI